MFWTESLPPRSTIPCATCLPHGLDAFLNRHQWGSLDGFHSPPSRYCQRNSCHADVVRHLKNRHQVIFPKSIVDALETPTQPFNNRSHHLYPVLWVLYLGCPCLTGVGCLEQIPCHGCSPFSVVLHPSTR